MLRVALLIALLSGCAHAQGLKPFSSDGCSLFPDGDQKDRKRWCVCCLQHDIAYWRGGTEAERQRADEELRTCVTEHTGNVALAETMYLGVRTGGSPMMPTWYRWSYGWNYGRGYTALTDQETAQANETLVRSARYSCD